MLTMHVSWSLFFFFFVSLLSKAFKKACFEQTLLSMLRRLFFDGKWFKKPWKNLSKIFFEKKKKIKLPLKKYGTFLRLHGQKYLMSKNSKMRYPKQRFLANFHYWKNWTAPKRGM